MKERIDWQKAYTQLAANQQALKDAFVLDERSAQQRLRQRAEKLGRRGIVRQQIASLRRVLVFALHQQHLAFDLDRIAKVTRLEKYAPVPGGPLGLLGVGNFDGEVRSVVDLHALLGIETPPNTRPGYALVLRWRQTELAVGTDAIERVAEFAAEEIRKPEDEVAEALRWSDGIAPDGTVLLNADKLFASAF